ATTRVFWALDVLGHKKMSILDGGIDKWKAEKRALTTEVPHYPKVTYDIPALHRDRIMTGEELEGYLGLYDRLGLMVIDSRRPSEFQGKEMSRASDKLGRIPGSTNLMFMALLTGKDYKEFKPAEEIQKIFTSKGLSPDKHLAFTCVSGCFGTVDYFAARLLNYPNVSVYDGAWIEWCKRNYPVEAAQGSNAPAENKTPPIKQKKQKIIIQDEGC
ncbi:MAG: rhodanese-like domain-containing protein, partial [Gammaproteobacteria bacterium]